ncbi:hypothetical protein LWX53_01270 [bacterium]|nr:hypothetical protein [bacterium]
MVADARAAELIALAGELASRGTYPPPARLAELAEVSIAAMRAEDPAVRPRAASGEPGGLVALGAPFVAIVPDLHARAAFLADLLASEPPAVEAPRGSGPAGMPEGRAAGPVPVKTTLAAMALEGRLAILCLGDVLNAEGPAAQARWTRAMEDLDSGGLPALLGPAMDEEMGLSIASLCLVMLLKARLGAAFHCLKGNHDNLTNSGRDGDSSFRKYALEGAMGAEWARLRYGEAVMAAVRRHELLLPLVAAGRAFCASHAEPAFPIDITGLLDYRSRQALVRALIWTANDQAMEGSVAESLDALLGERAAGGLWLTGHRPVPGTFALRAGGRLVQIHNPGRAQIAWIDNRPGAGRAGIRFYEVGSGGGTMRFLESLGAPS